MIRRFSASSGWDRSDEDTGSVYRRHWPILGNPCVYNGVVGGDSGGPLLDSSGRLCAINSTLLAPIPLPIGFQAFNIHAGVDSQETIDFIKNTRNNLGFGVVGDDGVTFDGLCPDDPTADVDTDGDNIPDACDGCPDNPDESQRDTDGDGTQDACDNCRLVPNGNQLDQDGDGIGFHCEICDCDPDVSHQDNDQDGICRLPCLGEPDNCPVDFNPEQANCNLVSELQHTPSMIWGDDCDPVPCPSQVGEPQDGEVLFRQDDQLLFIETVTVLRDELAIRPLRSHASTQFPGVAPQEVLGVPTSARYCLKDGDSGVTCDTSFDIQDARLLDAACAPTVASPFACVDGNLDVETSLDPFHRISFSVGGNGLNPNGRVPSLDYSFTRFDSTPDPDHLWTWDFRADITRWDHPSIDIFPGVEPPPDYGALDGALWLHGDTAVGSTGVFGHGQFLANHHDLAFQPEAVITRKGVRYAFQLAAPFFIWQTLPDPPEGVFTRWDAVRNESSIIAPVGSDWGALDLNGDVHVMTDRMGEGLVASTAAPDTVWVGSVEPYSHLGAGPAFPLAVGLTPNGAAVVDAVFTDGVSLLGAGDIDQHLPPFIGSPNATGFVPILSRVREGVFVVGGDDPSTGDPTGEIWFARLFDGTWSLVHSGIVPERVLAATFNYVTHELFVLDQTKGHKARLFAIDVRCDDPRRLTA